MSTQIAEAYVTVTLQSALLKQQMRDMVSSVATTMKQVGASAASAMSSEFNAIQRSLAATASVSRLTGAAMAQNVIAGFSAARVASSISGALSTAFQAGTFAISLAGAAGSAIRGAADMIQRVGVPAFSGAFRALFPSLSQFFPGGMVGSRIAGWVTAFGAKARDSLASMNVGNLSGVFGRWATSAAPAMAQLGDQLLANLTNKPAGTFFQNLAARFNVSGLAERMARGGLGGLQILARTDQAMERAAQVMATLRTIGGGVAAVFREAGNNVRFAGSSLSNMWGLLRNPSFDGLREAIKGQAAYSMDIQALRFGPNGGVANLLRGAGNILSGFGNFLVNPLVRMIRDKLLTGLMNNLPSVFGAVFGGSGILNRVAGRMSSVFGGMAAVMGHPITRGVAQVAVGAGQIFYSFAKGMISNVGLIGTAASTVAGTLIRGFGGALSTLRSFSNMLMPLAPLAIGGAALGTASTFAHFESSNLVLGALLRGASESDRRMLEHDAIRVGQQSIYSPTEVVRAQGIFARAGRTPSEIMMATEPAINLAITEEMSLVQATQAVSDVMGSLQLDATQLAHAVDVLGVAAVTSRTGLADMAFATRWAGPPAKNLGVEIEDLATSIAVMSEAGIMGGQAGRAMRTIFQRLADPTKQAKDWLKRMGVEAFEGEGENRRFVGMRSLIMQLSEGMKGLNEQERIAAAGDIAGVYQSSALLALVDIGAERFDFFREKLNNVTGYTAEVARANMSGLMGAFRQVAQAANVLAIALGGAVSPSLQSAAITIKGIVNNLTPWILANKTLINDMFQMGAAIAGILLVGPQLLHLITWLGRSMLLTPLGLIVGGVAAAVFAVRSFMRENQQAAGVLGTAWQQVSHVFLSVWNVMRSVFIALQPAFTAIGGQIIAFLGNLGEFVERNESRFQRLGVAMFNIFTNVIRLIGNVILELGRMMGWLVGVDGTADSWDAMLEGVTQFFEALALYTTNFSITWQIFTNNIKIWFLQTVDAMSAAWTRFRTGFMTGFNSAITFGLSQNSSVSGFASGFMSAFGLSGSSGWLAAGAGAQNPIANPAIAALQAQNEQLHLQLTNQQAVNMGRASPGLLVANAVQGFAEAVMQGSGPRAGQRALYYAQLLNSERMLPALSPQAQAQAFAGGVQQQQGFIDLLHAGGALAGLGANAAAQVMNDFNNAGQWVAQRPQRDMAAAAAAAIGIGAGGFGVGAFPAIGVNPALARRAMIDTVGEFVNDPFGVIGRELAGVGGPLVERLGLGDFAQQFNARQAAERDRQERMQEFKFTSFPDMWKRMQESLGGNPAMALQRRQVELAADAARDRQIQIELLKRIEKKDGGGAAPG